MDNSIVAIIPARGGSKRIPKKNIKNFLGRPIIEYTIDKAIQSGVFDRIIVSTDDEEIASIAINAGAEVPFLRSAENANDFAGTVSVLKEVLTKLLQGGETYDIGCCLYPTAPLLKISTLKNGLELLIGNNCDTVFPCVQYSYPIQRSLYEDKNGLIKMLHAENYHERSQDLEKMYHDAGQFYWFRTNYIINDGKLFSDQSKMILLSELEIQDIDTYNDWHIAEIKYQLMQSNRQNP